MKTLITTILLFFSVATFAQNNSGAFVFKEDANNLITTVPDTTNGFSALVWVMHVDGVNLQNIYQWYRGVPTGDSVAVYKARKWIIIPTGITTGYWSTPNFFISAAHVLNFNQQLQDYLTSKGITSGAASKMDSVRVLQLVGQKVTANVAITPNTNRLVSYDSKGLVTGGVPLIGGTGISISTGTITNTSPDQVVSLTAGNGIQISGTYPNFTISTIAPTFSFTTRTINSNFTPSATKPVLLFYSVLCSVTNPLLAGSSSATVTLQYSTNAGSTWQDVAQIGNLSSVALAVAVQITNGQTGQLSGIVPANALVRINSATTGTASVSVSKSTEVIY